VSGPDNYTRAYQQLTRTIPLIAMTEDMVAAGLVSSLPKPGGNTTGISLMSPELDGKRQELLMDAAPNARRITALFDATVTPPAHLQRLETMTTTRGLELSLIGASKREEVLPAINQAKGGGTQALNLLASPLFTVNLVNVVARLVELRLPAMHQWPDAAEEGGLIGYGVRFTEVFRQRARMVAKVLRGNLPGEIPIEQPEKFELSVNLRTAKAIGHAVPVSILLRANQVIE
jgi:putative ABC transport system substrate-binding protein